MACILITLHEQPNETTPTHFAVKYGCDEYDCYDFSNGLKALGHEVYFGNWVDLEDDIFQRLFHDNAKRFVDPPPLAHFDLIFAYKMPGFYKDMPRFNRMLDTFAKACPLVVNDPATIRHNIDKRYLWDLRDRGVTVPPTQACDDRLEAMLHDGKGPFVLKPIHGECGNGVMLVHTVQDLPPNRQDFLAQKFMPEVHEGERSLTFLGRSYQHAVLKRPDAQKQGEFRTNESLGGRVWVYEPTSGELEFALRTIDAYEDMGYPVHFSRIDMIPGATGPVLMEAEIISPSQYANYSGKGPVFGQNLAAYFERLMAGTSSGVGKAPLQATLE